MLIFRRIMIFMLCLLFAACAHAEGSGHTPGDAEELSARALSKALAGEYELDILRVELLNENGNPISTLECQKNATLRLVFAPTWPMGIMHQKTLELTAQTNDIRLNIDEPALDMEYDKKKGEWAAEIGLNLAAPLEVWIAPVLFEMRFKTSYGHEFAYLRDMRVSVEAVADEFGLSHKITLLQSGSPVSAFVYGAEDMRILWEVSCESGFDLKISGVRAKDEAFGVDILSDVDGALFQIKDISAIDDETGIFAACEVNGTVREYFLLAPILPKPLSYTNVEGYFDEDGRPASRFARAYDGTTALPGIAHVTMAADARDLAFTKHRVGFRGVPELKEARINRTGETHREINLSDIELTGRDAHFYAPRYAEMSIPYNVFEVRDALDITLTLDPKPDANGSIYSDEEYMYPVLKLRGTAAHYERLNVTVGTGKFTVKTGGDGEYDPTMTTPGEWSLALDLEEMLDEGYIEEEVAFQISVKYADVTGKGANASAKLMLYQEGVAEGTGEEEGDVGDVFLYLARPNHLARLGYVVGVTEPMAEVSVSAKSGAYSATGDESGFFSINMQAVSAGEEFKVSVTNEEGDMYERTLVGTAFAEGEVLSAYPLGIFLADIDDANKPFGYPFTPLADELFTDGEIVIPLLVEGIVPIGSARIERSANGYTANYALSDDYSALSVISERILFFDGEPDLYEFSMNYDDVESSFGEDTVWLYMAVSVDANSMPEILATDDDLDLSKYDEMLEWYY